MAERLLTIEDLAEVLGLPVSTLRRWRRKRTGPRGVRVGKHLRFRPGDVDAWLEKQADPQQTEHAPPAA